MNYTIAQTIEIHGGDSITVDYDKHGNKYIVGIGRNVKKDGERNYFYRKFDTSAPAHTAYIWLVKAVITGCYSFQQ